MRLSLVALLFVLFVFQSPPARSLSLNESASTESAIDALLARMTLAEKIGQLNFPSMAFPPEQQLEQVRAGRIGAMLNVANEAHIQAFSEAARASRLGIPLLFGIDAVYAFRIAFPPPIAWAA